MVTFLDDMKKHNAALAADYALVGNQSLGHLRCMVKALSMCTSLNTKEDEARLAAAQRIIAHHAKIGRKQ